MAAPFAFILVLGIDFFGIPQEEGIVPGIFAVAVALLWYAQAQIRWFTQDLDISTIKSAITFFGAFMVATVAALSISVMINLDAQSFAPGPG